MARASPYPRNPKLLEDYFMSEQYYADQLTNDLARAVSQLHRSDRGCDALRSFIQLLDANESAALGLDSPNWTAIEVLVRSCRLGGAANVRELFSFPEDSGVNSLQPDLARASRFFHRRFPASSE